MLVLPHIVERNVTQGRWSGKCGITESRWRSLAWALCRWGYVPAHQLPKWLSLASGDGDGWATLVIVAVGGRLLRSSAGR